MFLLLILILIRAYTPQLDILSHLSRTFRKTYIYFETNLDTHSIGLHDYQMKIVSFSAKCKDWQISGSDKQAGRQTYIQRQHDRPTDDSKNR